MVKQSEIGVKQYDITDCGAACLVSVCAYYGLYCTISQIRRLSFTDKQGTSVLGMIKAAESLGLTAKGVKAEAEALTKIKLPCIAHTMEKEGLLHFIVVYSLTSSWVEYMNPSDGKLHRIDISDFLQKWTGVLILLERGEDFQKGNMRRSSVRTLMSLLWSHKGAVIQILFGSIISSILGLGMAIYSGRMLDYAITAQDAKPLHLMAGIMFCVVVARVATTTWKNRLSLNTSCLIDAFLILGYYRHLLKLPQMFFDTMRIGEVLSRIGDAVKIRSFINETIVSIVVNFLVFLQPLL